MKTPALKPGSSPGGGTISWGGVPPSAAAAAGDEAEGDGEEARYSYMRGADHRTAVPAWLQEDSGGRGSHRRIWVLAPPGNTSSQGIDWRGAGGGFGGFEADSAATDPRRALAAPPMFRWRACSLSVRVQWGSSNDLSVSVSGCPDVSGTAPLIVGCDSCGLGWGGEMMWCASTIIALRGTEAPGSQIRLEGSMHGLGGAWDGCIALMCTPRRDVAAAAAGDRFLGTGSETGRSGSWLGGDEEAAAAGDADAKSRLADLALLGKGEGEGARGCGGARFGRRSGGPSHRVAGGGGGVQAFSTAEEGALQAMRAVGGLSAREAGPMGSLEAGRTLLLGGKAHGPDGAAPAVWLESFSLS